MLLISISESSIEIGCEGGKTALEHSAKNTGHIESIWKPVTATESFEIVFTSEIDYPARVTLLSTFRKLYASNSGKFADSVAEGDYFRLMQEAYPIPPSYLPASTKTGQQLKSALIVPRASMMYQLVPSTDIIP